MNSQQRIARRFRVTPGQSSSIKQGKSPLTEKRRDLIAAVTVEVNGLVAEENGVLIGLLVYYFVPFTYRAKPNVIIKELYVADEHRSKGVGKLLMKAIATEAEQAGCGLIKWYVAKWNQRGIEFYERLGAKIDPNWHEFQMSEKTFRDLAAS